MPTERPKGLGKVVLRCAVGFLTDRGIGGHLYFRACRVRGCWSPRMALSALFGFSSAVWPLKEDGLLSYTLQQGGGAGQSPAAVFLQLRCTRD